MPVTADRAFKAMPWHQPTFWAGTLNNAEEPRGIKPDDRHAGMVLSRREAIRDKLSRGVPLEAIPEFWQWLGRPDFEDKRLSPAAVPADDLSIVRPGSQMLPGSGGVVDVSDNDMRDLINTGTPW